jgi:hypothetical protein
MPKCAACGEAAPPGAAFCSHCGKPLPKGPPVPPPELPPRALPLPDRASLRGPCTVIYAGVEDLDIRRVGRLVAEAAGRPLPDMTRELRSSKGILASRLDATSAVALADKIERDLQAPVLVVPDEALVPLPPALRMRQAHIGAAGLRCEAYSWDTTQGVDAAWKDVFLVCCGRLEVQEAVEVRDESATPNILVPRPGSLTMQRRYEYLLDIVLADPWRRLRLDQNTVAYSMTEMKRSSEMALGSIFRSALNLERFGQSAPRNRAVGLLAAGASDVIWDSLTFLNKRDFDSYTHWLMQLVRYGRPIA